MNKNLTTIIGSIALLLGGLVSATAQNMYDAINFSKNEYYGTARTISLGGAVTALGGDLGSVGINPAGSAVATYSQIEITPGLSISSVKSSFLSGEDKAKGSQFTIPNVGFSYVHRSGRERGVKNWSIGIIYNRTTQYNYSTDVRGVNSLTSKTAEVASAARGFSDDQLGAYNSFDGNIPWDILTAYQGGLIGSYQDGTYAGITEAIAPNGMYSYLPGELFQNSQTRKKGSKSDLIINFALNVSDKVYVGLNVGVPTMRYKYTESFYESALDPSQFGIIFNGPNEQYQTNFVSSAFGYNYSAKASGIYAKLGVIVVPVKGLRIGAAIQTPTSMYVKEDWRYDAAARFENNYFDDSSSSPTGSYKYHLRTPYSFNAGLAYTFGKVGLVSVDYELTDFSAMKFSSYDDDDYYEYDYGVAYDEFADVNNAMRKFAGLSHQLRIGLELKPLPMFAIRAGYSLSTSPERYWSNNTGDVAVTYNDYLADYDSYWSHKKILNQGSYYKDKTHSVSFGLGYSSSRSFYADIAVRWTKYPDAVFAPYYDYPNYDANGGTRDALSPLVYNKISRWMAVITVGWRF